MLARIQGDQWEGVGWPEFAGSDPMAAAGVQTSTDSMPQRAEGPVVCTYELYACSRIQREHPRDQ